ncbi:MAG: nucleoside phosphorylase [Prevotellaceae bacterium]|nr:nucleoside phosphorylase [Prevotellaceae bacterium]
MQKIAPSELMINSDGSIFHLHLLPNELADTVILVGDPDRAYRVSEFFDSVEFKRQSREFVSATGLYKGCRMTVLSTGIGTDNIDIVLNELDALSNIDFDLRIPKSTHRSLRIVRVGTSGALQPDIPIGTHLLSAISVGFDGLLNWYAGRDQISLLDYEYAFVDHMKWSNQLPAPYFVPNSPSLIDLLLPISIPGITISAPGFYGPQGRVLRLPLLDPDLLNKIESFGHKGQRICNFEMEGSAIAGLSALLGHEAATICFIIANRHLHQSNTSYKPLMDRFIESVLNKLSEPQP